MIFLSKIIYLLIMTKIAITGKMCSGKTTIATYLIAKNNQFVKISFADKVKEIATDLFNMKEKNRYLLQSIGTKMREIDEDVWASYTVNKACKQNFVIIDDLRYKNEMNKYHPEEISSMYTPGPR